MLRKPVVLRAAVPFGAALAFGLLAAPGPATAVDAEGAASAAIPGAGPVPSEAQRDAHQRVSDVPDTLVPVATARDLVGRSLETREGADLPIRYVGIRIADGRVRFLAVEPEEGPADELLAVPWDVVQASLLDDALRVRATREELAGAPRLTRAELEELTRPVRFATLTGYWAPIRMAREERPPGADRPDPSEEATAPDVATAPPAGAETEAQPHVLVGRRIVTTLAPPVVRYGDQMQGATVRTPEGAKVGTIDELALDLRWDRVAWAVIRSGSFFDRAWYAVPFDTLQWVPDAGTLRFRGDPEKLVEMDALDASEAPLAVERDALAELYRRFDVTPYWRHVEANVDATPSGD
ncbi:MAG: PRC-barrel domain-containing protein [Myxococcota bacterium]|nr:PRC-barrel domain-containing protein [Myxococcota bacterium]